MIHGVEVVQVPVPSSKEEQGRRFYGGILGLREISRTPNFGRNGSLSYVLPDGRELLLNSTDEFRPQRRVHLTLTVSNLDALDEALGKAGHRTEWDFSLSQPRFYCQDPFGNRLQFTSGEE